jgi:hypothetical protein
MALNYKSSLSRYRRYLQTMQEKPLWMASLWLILSLILMIAMVTWALRPTLVTIAGLMGQIKQEKILSEKLDEKIRAAQKANDLLDEVRPRLAILDEGLPQQSKWNEVADRLQKTATQSGVQVSGINLDGIPIIGNLTTTTDLGNRQRNEQISLPAGVQGVSFVLIGKGSYLQIRQMLTSLQDMRRMTVINTAQITKEADGGLVLSLRGVAGFIPLADIQ